MICKYEPDEFARRLVWQAYDSYKIDVSYMDDDEAERAKREKFSMVDYRLARHDDTELIGEKYLRKSLSVGDQTSQITAITFPTPIDNLVKIVNGCKYYGRYMDDFYVIAKTVDELKEIQRQICEEADGLKIIINRKKTYIGKLGHSFTFLQFKYYLRENGHVVVRINPKTVTRMRTKLKKLKGLVDSGEVRLEKAESLFQSWIANYSRYMSKKQTKNLITLYRELFGEGLNQWMKTKSIA